MTYSTLIKNCGGDVMFGCRSANAPNRSDWHVQENTLVSTFVYIKLFMWLGKVRRKVYKKSMQKLKPRKINKESVSYTSSAVKSTAD